jgi:hypothetical protein
MARMIVVRQGLWFLLDSIEVAYICRQSKRSNKANPTDTKQIRPRQSKLSSNKPNDSVTTKP